MAIPLNEKQKAHLRRLNGVKARFAQRDQPIPFKVKEYEQLPLLETFTPKRVGKHGSFSGSRLNAATRAIIARRNAAREKFMAAVKDGSVGA